MARDVPLEIKYSDYVANIDPETFWAQIGGRITQYKSFEITTRHWDHVLPVLKQANTPNLKTLYLGAPWFQEWNESVITLFEGEPASGALKDLHVGPIPLAIAPLRLTGLRSLELNGLPRISMEEVLRVLRESPGLEKCDLLHLTCLRDAGFALAHRIPDYPTIQLSRLRSLNLRGLPVSITHSYTLSHSCPETSQVFRGRQNGTAWPKPDIRSLHHQDISSNNVLNGLGQESRTHRDALLWQEILEEDAPAPPHARYAELGFQ